MRIWSIRGSFERSVFGGADPGLVHVLNLNPPVAVLVGGNRTVPIETFLDS